LLIDIQVWEFLSSVEVMVLVQEELQKAKGSSTAATVACETLIARAANKWQAQEGDYRDGMCVLQYSILYI
jgi:conjugal transfer/entry exclusion protein